MEIIEMTECEFKKLKPFYIARGIANSEAKFYYENETRRRLLKAYNSVISKNFRTEKREDIMNVIKFTEEHDIPELAAPEGIFLVNDLFRGSIVPRISGVNASVILNGSNIPLRSKLEVLKQIGIILTKIHLADSFAAYSDVHADNFVVNGFNWEILDDISEIRTYGVDTESMSLYGKKGRTNYYFAGLPYTLKPDKYEAIEYGLIVGSQNTDIFCFIMMILELISNNHEMQWVSMYDFDRYLDYLSKLGFDSRLLMSFASIYDDRIDNINPLPYIDTIKDIPVEASYEYYRK